MLKRLRVPAFLLLAAFLTYGILAPKLGFYWDALPIGWIRYQLGAKALTQYFSTNRPFWGMIYQLTTRLLPYQPLPWQIFSILWRWATALLFWLLLRQIFEDQPRFAFAAALLFLLYPGFNQQSIAFIYSHYFIVLSAFLASLWLMLLAARRDDASSKWMTGASLLLSAVNLLAMEYFFLLDLIRPILLWWTLDSVSQPRARLRETLKRYAPYFLVFLLVVLGKIFLFPNQTYGYSLLDNLKENPLAALGALLYEILSSLHLALFASWWRAFLPPDFALQGARTLAVYGAVILILYAAGLFLLKTTSSEESSRRTRAKQTIFLGITLVLLGGVPFWLTGLHVSLNVPASRFLLAFLPGSVFFFGGLLLLIPKENLRIAAFALLIAASAGRQFLWTDEFRRDWVVQKNLFWQMSWRIPALEPHTLFFMNEGALKFYADNSLSAPLNWIYAPPNPAPDIPYMLFYPHTRLGGELTTMEENIPLSHDFLAGEFHGNTSQSIAVYFAPPSCFRVLDPDIDPYNPWVFDKNIRQAARFSDTQWILTTGTPTLPDIYAPEPSHQRWCYYFERADLARQKGEWEKVAALGDKAFASGDYPNDPTERFVFIEGYAHAGQWETALKISRQAHKISPAYMDSLLCRLWSRIQRETPNSPEKQKTLAEIQQLCGCASP